MTSVSVIIKYVRDSCWGINIMKQEIIVPVITNTTENLVMWMNEQIRMMNLMVDQLYWQNEKMIELRQEKEKYFASRERRVQAVKDAERRYQEKCEAVERAEKEHNELPWFAFKRRYSSWRRLADLEEQQKALHGLVLRANHTLNSKDDYYGRVEEVIKKVNIPNYINHLSKFYGALRTYREYAKKFKKVTGVKAPAIDDSKIIIYNGEKGQLPVVDIDKNIPTIELGLDYDNFDESEL